eukprot:gene15511-17092_t
MRFQVFKVQNWQTVSPRHANTDDCLDELRYSYSKLSDEQKAAISTPRANQQHKLFCICRQRYKPSDPTMALLNYMRHQEEQQKDAKRITELDDVIASMDEESKNILQNHEFLPAPIDRSAIVSDNLNHIRGIQNPISTCWLNAIVHLVCGTGIIGLLLSYSSSAETEISRELIITRIRLVGKAKSAVSLRQRAIWDSRGGRIKQTPVVIPQSPDMTPYASTQTNQPYSYNLQAIVSHYAATSSGGHYACHIFNGESVTTYNDKDVKKRTGKTLLGLRTIQASAHMVAYFLNINSEEHVASNVCTTSSAEERSAEKYWFAQGRKDALVTTTTFMTRISKGRANTAECSQLLRSKSTFQMRVIIIPINVDGNHWIISAI